MKLEILGTGCAKCEQLYQNTQKAVQELGIDVEIVKVEDIDKIVDYGVMMTPGLVIDGEVKSTGKALSPAQIKKYLQ
jgi:small redox-active disulfide protein 2